MSKSAFVKYDPSYHTGEYGWLWIEDENGELSWHLICTIEDDGDLQVHFPTKDRLEGIEACAGKPFLLVSPPPSEGHDAPGFILTIDTLKGERMTFSWGPHGVGSGEFAQIVVGAVEHAMAGADV